MKNNNTKEKENPCCKASYKRGYDLGYKHSKRSEKRLLKIKLFVREIWRILSLVDDKDNK